MVYLKLNIKNNKNLYNYMTYNNLNINFFFLKIYLKLILFFYGYSKKKIFLKHLIY